MDDSRDLSTSLARLVRAVVPEVERMPGCVLARVKKVHAAGGRMTGLEPRYSVDVQVLAPDGSDDGDWPILPDVEISVLWAGPNRGVYCTLAEGAIVRVGFEYGDVNRPYIESITGRGYDAPDHPVGAWVVQSGDTRVEISAGGEVRIVGMSGVTIDAGSDGTVELKGASVKLSAPAVDLGSGQPMLGVALGPHGTLVSTVVKAAQTPMPEEPG